MGDYVVRVHGSGSYESHRYADAEAAHLRALGHIKNPPEGGDEVRIGVEIIYEDKAVILDIYRCALPKRPH